MTEWWSLVLHSPSFWMWPVIISIGVLLADTAVRSWHLEGRVADPGQMFPRPAPARSAVPIGPRREQLEPMRWMVWGDLIDVPYTGDGERVRARIVVPTWDTAELPAAAGTTADYDPAKVDFVRTEHAMASAAAIRAVAPDPEMRTGAEIAAELEAWVNGHLADFAVRFDALQRTTDVRMAPCMLRAVTWAIEGAAAGVAGEGALLEWRTVTESREFTAREHMQLEALLS